MLKRQNFEAKIIIWKITEFLLLMVQVGSQKYGGYFKLFFTFTSHLYPNVTKYSQFCYIILWEELTKFDSEEIDES